MGQKATGGVKTDQDRVTRHRPSAQSLRRCCHDFNGTSDSERPEWDYRTESWEFGTHGGDGVVT
jgi:hypothetical protein